MKALLELASTIIASKVQYPNKGLSQVRYPMQHSITEGCSIIAIDEFPNNNQ